MPKCSLALPYNDTDLTGKQDIIFEVGGGGNLTATLPLPVSTVGLDYGYYNLKDHDTTGVCLGARVASALTAADAETWTASEASTGLPGRLVLTRGGSPATVEIKWDHASTTFEAEWVGFDSSSSSSGTSQVTATWPAGRLFLPPRVTFQPSRPTRTVVTATAYSGKTESRRLHSGYNRYRFAFQLLAPPYIYLYAAADADWYQGVYEMVQNDPNTPLEALWTWLDTRPQLRYQPDRDDASEASTLRVVDSEALQSLLGMAEDLANGSANPMLTVDFEAIDYV